MCVVCVELLLRWVGTILARAPHVLYPGSGIDPARVYDVMLTYVGRQATPILRSWVVRLWGVQGMPLSFRNFLTWFDV